MDLFTLSASLGLDITNFQTGVDSARRILLRLAGAVVDFGKDVIETGMGFDEQMSAVQAVMGLTENTAENLATMNKLREFALEQARDSIFTSEETAKAYYYMGMAGWRADQMISGLPGVMSLAAASGEDLKMVSDMVTDSLTAFGLSADHSSHFADVLAVTATNANTDVARMQQTFKNLAPIAGALGYSIEDVALSVGLIANSGIKGSMAGTALRNIFTRIATNAGATSNTLGALSIVTDKLGVAFYDAEGKARDWGDVLTDIRAAWAGMDEETRNGIMQSFDSTINSSEEAKIALEEFVTDAEKVKDIQGQLAKQKDGEVWDEYANTIGNIGKQYDELLKLLSVPIPERPEEYADALDQARIKLGLMSDQEQIYYGKQIGSLRGISGFLALVTAGKDDVDNLTKAIENADGAAKKMADTRLDNLQGDVVRFNAALDVLKIAVYDDVKGPLREVVQYGTDALNRITDAVNEKGLTGGIEQLSAEINSIGTELAPIMTEIGKAAAPMLESIITDLLPSITAAGTALASGFITGLGQGLMGSGGIFSGFLGAGLNLLGDTGQLVSGLTGLFAPSKEPVKIPGQVEITPEVLQSAIDEANRQGTNEIIINDLAMPVSAYQNMLDELQQESMVGLSRGMAYGGQTGSQEVVTTFETAADTIGSDVSGALSDAGNDGATSIAKDLVSNVKSTSREIISGLGGSFASAGSTGGAKMADNVSSAVVRKGDYMKSSLASKLGQAGSSAGSTIANAIQSAINAAKFTANIIASVSSFFSGSTEKHAKSMYNGTILRGATIFGVNRNGMPLVGGESGPEAIVGVNSLNRTIANAVNAGLRSYIAANNTTPAPQQPMYLVLNGKVVGRVLASDNANAAAEYNRSIAVGYGG